MYIWMIWAKVGNGAAGTSGNEVWLMDAWDDDSIDGNPEGWDEAKKKAYEAVGPDQVVINKHLINFDKVLDQFNSTTEV